MAKCKGCGEEIHYVKDRQRPEKWHAQNADNSQHYCGGPKKEFIVTAVPAAAAAPTERGEVTLSQREWGHLREQLVAIQMQLSEIWQEQHTIRTLIEATTGIGKSIPFVDANRSVEAASRSVEDQINDIDFDQLFNDNNPG